MRRLDLLLMSLVFVLAAGPAAADPVSTAIIGFLGISSTGWGAALIRIGVGLATSALSNAIGGPKRGSAGPRGFKLQSKTAGDQTPQSFILGRYVTAGNLAAPEMSHGVDGDTRYLTQVIDLSDIRVEGLDSLIIDGVACDLATGNPATLQMTAGDGPTPAIHPDYGPTINKGDFIGVAWCKFYDGTQTVADPMLLAKYGSRASRPWKSDMVGTGLSYAIMTFFQRNSPIVWQGRPTVRFVLRGIRLYDPRKDSTAGGSGSHRYTNSATHEWTDNPIVMAYNVLRGISIPPGQTDEVFGGGFTASQLPYATWAAAMNACDVVVGSGDNARKRYTGGLEVDIGDEDAGGMTPADVVEELLRACAGQITDVGGTLYVRVGAPGLPVKFITDDDVLITSSQDMDPFDGAQDSYNVVHATYMSPGHLWTPKEATPRKDADAIAADGQELPANLSLAAVTSSGQAQQLMAALLKDEQRRRRHTITLPPEGILLRPLEVIDWTSARNGYTGKNFEIGQVSIDPMSLSATLALREVSPADFDWDVGQELAEDAPDVDTLPPDRFRGMAAPGLEVRQELRLANEQPVGVMIVTCRSSDIYLDRFEVSYRKTGTTTWRAVASSDLDTFEVVGLSDGQFDVRARAVSTYGARSAYTQMLAVPLTFFSDPPANVTGFSADVVGGVAVLKWNPVPDADLSHYRIRYSKRTAGATYQNAVNLVDKVPRPGVSVTVPAQTGTYFIKAVDKGNRVSAASASLVINTNLAAVESMNVVETITAHPAFVGTKTNVVATTAEGIASYLVLDTTGLFDGGAGLFDDALGLFDGGGGGDVVSSGTYEIGTVIDLGAVYTSLIESEIDVLALDYVASFDSADGLFDDRAGLFDGEAEAQDTTSAQMQFAATSGDPGASPTWSDWSDFTVTNVTARALKFRCRLESRSPTASPAVTEIKVSVDMPDRSERQSDITYTGSQVITYPQAFKAIPAIGIAAVLAAGDRYEISARSRSGFTITTKNSAGNTSTSPTTIDYVATGYGRQS